MPMTDLKLKKKWLKALRSGKYKQGAGYLCALEGRGNDKEYCCLGVLGEIQGAKWKEDKLSNDSFNPSINGRSIMKPGQQYLTESKAGGLTYDEQSELGGLNDSGYTFLEIADRIEADY